MSADDVAKGKSLIEMDAKGEKLLAEAIDQSRLHVTIFDTLCGIEFGVGAAQVAEAILASDWLRDRDAAKWEEGVKAHSNSSSIFTRDTLEKNPYRENPNPNGVRSGDVVKIAGRAGKWEVGMISLSHEAYLLDIKGTRVTRAQLSELTPAEAK